MGYPSSAENKALIMDHLHYRSHTSEDITEVDSPTLQRHEEFTSEILESLEAKVFIVYGSKVQNRLIATRNLVHMQLWGEYSEVSIALDLEKNYKFSDDNYRFSRVFLLAAHPNRIMWQTKGNRTLIRQDAILKAAANMAGVSGLVVPQLYRNKLWSRDNPQRSAFLKEIRDKTQYQYPKTPRRRRFLYMLLKNLNPAGGVVFGAINRFTITKPLPNPFFRLL